MDDKKVVAEHVGLRLKRRREMLGLTQAQLGSRLGVTFQQVQKYERGANCMTAARLHDAAEVLQVPVQFFFEGLPSARAMVASSDSQGGGDPLMSTDNLELLNELARLPAETRASIVSLVQTLRRH